MKRISSREVHSSTIESLGLDSSIVDLTSIEAAAALLRRAGGFFCPCPPSRLLRLCRDLLQGLGLSEDQEAELFETTLESLVAYGDFVESRDITRQSSERLLYATPASFVEVSHGYFLLFGITRDDDRSWERSLTNRIEPVNHCRVIRTSDSEGCRTQLQHCGVRRVAAESWLRMPDRLPVEDHVHKYDRALDDCVRAGSVDDLTILDFSLPVRFYKGRWTTPKKHSGRYVARRPQLYGADLWCYVELDAGRLTKLVDFPLFEKNWRACDEAWHLQQAIDRMRDMPQRFRVRPVAASSEIAIDVFSPFPAWAKRRWDYTGKPVMSSGCLFSYCFSRSSLAEQKRFLEERMWLSELTAVDVR